MKFYKAFFRLVLVSWLLDIQLLGCRFPSSFLAKIEFIAKKYVVLIQHHFLGIPVSVTSAKITINRRKFFYASVFGLGVFQKMVVDVHAFVLPVLASIENPVIIDVGAHVGFFAIPLSQLLKKSEIYALEPVSITFRLLQKNIRGIASIKPYRIGLYDKPQKMTMYYEPEKLLYSSVFSKRFTWNKYPHQERVTLKTLDTFCAENGIGSIDFLKIDAEGAEQKILSGAKKMLAHTRFVFIECSLDQPDEISTFTSLMSQLSGKKHQFQLVKITSTLKDSTGHLLLVNVLLENLRFKN
ncbi:FkbM family methyltransferase [Candidatus Microgenomates bacterium]|nr:MAG: FkbM family methyltransferase [Candidatus Microgenomates bacterium]